MIGVPYCGMRVKWLPLFYLGLALFLFTSTQSVKSQSVVEIPTDIKKEILKDVAIGEEFEKKSDFGQAVFHFNKSANVYWVYGYLDNAIELFQKALTLSERIGNDNGIYVLNTNIGLISVDKGENEKALKHFANATQLPANWVEKTMWHHPF